MNSAIFAPLTCYSFHRMCLANFSRFFLFHSIETSCEFQRSSCGDRSAVFDGGSGGGSGGGSDGGSGGGSA